MRQEAYKRAKILVVDDEPANVLLLARILERAGFSEVTTTIDAREAVPLCASLDPDLLILDLSMPFVDGFGVMEELAKRLPEDTYLPILVITADTTRAAMHRALTMGARDFLLKPIDTTDVLLRIGNLLEARFLHQRLQDQKGELEEQVRERTAQLTDSLARATELAEHRRELLGQLANAEVSAAGRPKAG
jgi:PleD family two-component response regulator